MYIHAHLQMKEKVPEFMSATEKDKNILKIESLW